MSKILYRMAACVALCASLSACDFTQMPESVAAYSMHLSDYDVTVMVGDTVDVTCLFEPDAVTAPKAFWHKRSPNIAIDNADGYTCHVVGTQPGDAWVYAITLNDNLQDSCLVHVLERWDIVDIRPADYEFDMIVIADVVIDGVHNSPDILTAAYMGSTLCGKGEVRSSMGLTYTLFRVYSDNKDGHKVTFRYYAPDKRKGGELDYSLPFDINHHGTLTSPIVMSND